MHTPIHLTGQLPDHWKEALAILADDLVWSRMRPA